MYMYMYMHMYIYVCVYISVSVFVSVFVSVSVSVSVLVASLILCYGRARLVFAVAILRQRKDRPADDTELAGHSLYRI